MVTNFVVDESPKANIRHLCNTMFFHQIFVYIYDITDINSLVINQPRPQSNFKKIALAPHDYAGNFYLI